MFALGCRCARHIFRQWQKDCCHKIGHRCLPWGVDVQDTFFDSGRKIVAMVTAYYGKNCRGKVFIRFGTHVGLDV